MNVYIKLEHLVMCGKEDITDIKGDDALDLLLAYNDSVDHKDEVLSSVCDLLHQDIIYKFKCKCAETILNSDVFNEDLSIKFDEVYNDYHDKKKQLGQNQNI